MANKKAIKERLQTTLSPERFKHSLRVQKTAEDLARHYGAPLKKASLAGLLHDCARAMEGADLLRLAEGLKIINDPLERIQPKLLHAQLSAYLAKKEFGIKDQEILGAIANHTVGKEKMTLLEKIVYLADHIEPERNFKGVDRVRVLAYRDLDKAVAETAGAVLRFLLEKGLPVYPKTVTTRNFYLQLSHGKN